MSVSYNTLSLAKAIIIIKPLHTQSPSASIIASLLSLGLEGIPPSPVPSPTLGITLSSEFNRVVKRQGGGWMSQVRKGRWMGMSSQTKHVLT